MIKRYALPVYIKGMVFAILIMFFTSSCCVTGYCQIAQDDTQEKSQAKTNN